MTFPDNGALWDRLSAFSARVGTTPVRPLPVSVGGRKHMLSLKLELQNPTGSVKDRTALGLLWDLGERGLIGPGSTIVESTSGNLGVALAHLARELRMKFIAVVDPTLTAENRARMETLGAEIVMVQERDANGGYLLSRLARVRELEESRGAVWPNQYQNQANPEAHYATTGPEIYEYAREHSLDAVFLAVSTGGTFAGVSRFFAEHMPQLPIFPVDIVGSVVFCDRSSQRHIPGLGSSRKSDFIEAMGDHAPPFTVTTDQATAVCDELLRRSGVSVGGSSGAVVAAALLHLRSATYANNVLCLCADSGESYGTTILNQEWRDALGLHSFDLVFDDVVLDLEVSTRLISALDTRKGGLDIDE